jgi:hypothetical protein
MPHDRPPDSGPYPLEPDTDEAPPTEEVLGAVVTEEVRRDGLSTDDFEDEDLADDPTDGMVRLPTEDQWYDPDEGQTEELPVGRKVAPWFALLGAFVVVAGALWGLGIVSLPGLSADGGKAACERTCSNLGTEVVSYSQDECVCARE